MITALLLTVAVAGQLADEPIAKPQPTPAKKAIRKTQTKAEIKAQAESVLRARKARRASSNQRRAVREAQEQVDYQRQLDEQAKLAKAQQDYVIKMGPIWAAEHANQIQQQRNALIAQRNSILQQQAANEAYLLYQLRASQAR